MDPRRRRIVVDDSSSPSAPNDANDADFESFRPLSRPVIALGIVIGATVAYLAWQTYVPSPAASEVTTVVVDSVVVAPAVEVASESERPRSRTRSATVRPSEPSPAPTPAAVDDTPTLPARSSREIQSAFAADRASYGACYQTGLANNPRIEGTVAIRFRVESDGRVTGVTVVRTTLGSAVVEDCLVEVISRWRFRSGMMAETYELEFPFAPG